jgi:hypothetical protein
MAKGVPLLPYDIRRQLVDHLWRALEASRPRGMSFAMMSAELNDFAQWSSINVPVKAIYKLTYTLNIAKALSEDGMTGRFVRNPDMVYDCFLPVMDANAALEEMNRTYLTGIRIERPTIELIPEAVALLLFDSRDSWAIEAADRLIHEVESGTRLAYSTTGPADLASNARLSVGPDTLQALRGVVVSLREAGRIATGAAVRQALWDGYLPFRMSAESISFKQLAELAEQKGYVQIVQHQGSDFELVEPDPSRPQS